MIDEQITAGHTAELARLLRAGRTARGWTLRKAAAETGISNGYLSLIEQSDVKAPSPRYLMILAEKYGLPFDRLMALAGHPSGPSVVPPRQPALTPPEEQTSSTPSNSAALAGRGARDGSTETWSAGAPVFGFGVEGTERGRLLGTVREGTPEEHDVRHELTALVLDDVRALSVADIAQVRAFIAGLRAARRS